MSNPSTPTSMYERTNIRYGLLFTIIGTFAVALIAFCGTNFFGTRDLREIAKAPNSELEWLRREFHLSDTQFAKIATLQSAYTPVCDEMCRRIMEANSKLDRLVSENHEVTPDLPAAIREAGLGSRRVTPTDVGTDLPSECANESCRRAELSPFDEITSDPASLN